ncbi:lytic transglycosylase domain-containing protein [Pseudoalteromonas luteoviolacea]|uniref:lytic transglycosylase domain-containing protein n=1 Tax=Pseudoalteromonas luteoviolacea TaxID=43657 RepID=UPI001B37C2E7|nr:lytic transglycosylase domain-containing protein [Pseudoalteromonas luteoviolacea]MBQ4840008.1 lytic transglycosylase domain-containing protein [Pseudoalteromonas luteoviolacea]
MLHKCKASCIFALSLTSSLLASELPDAESTSSNCWVDAGTRYQVDPWLLYSIAEQESSLNPLAVNQNSDKSRDIGLMQINSFWFPELEKYGLSEQNLFDPCTNIYVGAWILSQSIQVFGNNWRAVGAYNAGTGKNEKREKLRQKYAERVYKRYVRITNGGLYESAKQTDTK